MPRVQIQVQDIDELEELEQQEDWELQLGLANATARAEVRDTSTRSGPREQRFRGSEALDRKRQERRKQIKRGKKH